MASTYFEATNVWQELTGISEVAGKWTVQNAYNIDGIKIYAGADPVPTDGKGAIVVIKGFATTITNSGVLEKVWVKTVSTNEQGLVELGISKG